MSIVEKRMMLVLKAMLEITDEQNLKDVPSRSIRNQLGFEYGGDRGATISGTLTGAYSLAVTKKYMKVKGDKPSQKIYTLLPAGRKYLQSRKKQVEALDLSVFEASQNYTSRKPPSTERYSGQALSAIEGISELINQNDRLVQSIRAVYAQLGGILREIDHQKASEGGEDS